MSLLDKIGAIFFLLTGAAIPVAWGIIFSTAGAPDFWNTPFSGTFHLASEFLLSLSCLASGTALIKMTRWSKRLTFTACGMLMASVINAGAFYFFDPANRDTVSAGLILLLFLVTFTLFIFLYRESIRSTGGAGGLFLLLSGLLVYVLLNCAGHFGQKCLDESGVHSGIFFLLILGSILLTRFALRAVFRESPYIIRR